MNKILFFSDIDDTLIFSKRKVNFQKELVVAGYNKDKEPFSYFYKDVKKLLDLLLEAGITFIPNTARNLSSYKRTIFYKNEKIKYAVLNFGGIILKNGKICQEWNEIIQHKYKYFDLKSIEKEIKQLFDFGVEIKIIDNFYISIYNKFFRDDENICSILENILTNYINGKNLKLYLNKNSFAIYPSFLGKEKATKFLIKELKPTLILGAGDSNSDLEFMKLANISILPTNSDLFTSLN